MSETDFSLTSTSTTVCSIANDNIYFTAPQMVASDINETNEMSGSKSLFVNAILSTTSRKLSPVIDTTKNVVHITVQNRINSPTSGNTPSFR